ncbi:ABC transporter permease [Agromyces sp. SYSU T00194]|uniref:ABC transporter permease n=1 Tax=Agromyces chitinivorans TaxID=3158560 RepID=UPI003393FD59
MSDTRTPHTPLARVLVLAAALVAAVAVIVLAFSWPSVTAEPRDLPVAIAGPAEAVAQIEAGLGDAQPDAIAFTEVADRDEAVEAIEAREVYGAIVLGQQPEVLTSSAASAAVAQLLGGAAAQLQQAANAQAAAAAQAQGLDTVPTIEVTVTDVVPLADTDPRGTGLASAMFPLVLGGMIGGIAITFAVIGALRRVLAVVVYSGGAGLALAGILGGWFGSLPGDYWPNAGAIALTLLAVSAFITGMSALLGRAGLGLGALTILLVANPISSAAVPKEFLPAPWGEVGQWFPPGAGATLLRDVNYFPSADTAFPLLVLTGWAVVGLVLSVVGHFRTAGGAESDAEAAHEDDPVAEPERVPA